MGVSMNEELLKLRDALEEMRRASLFKKPLVAEKALLAAVVLIEQMVGEIEKLKSEQRGADSDT
jgi:hypothetical protein